MPAAKGVAAGKATGSAAAVSEGIWKPSLLPSPLLKNLVSAEATAVAVGTRRSANKATAGTSAARGASEQGNRGRRGNPAGAAGASAGRGARRGQVAVSRGSGQVSITRGPGGQVSISRGSAGQLPVNRTVGQASLSKGPQRGTNGARGRGTSGRGSARIGMAAATVRAPSVQRQRLAATSRQLDEEPKRVWGSRVAAPAATPPASTAAERPKRIWGPAAQSSETKLVASSAGDTKLVATRAASRGAKAKAKARTGPASVVAPAPAPRRWTGRVSAEAPAKKDDDEADAESLDSITMETEIAANRKKINALEAALEENGQTTRGEGKADSKDQEGSEAAAISTVPSPVAFPPKPLMRERWGEISDSSNRDDADVADVGEESLKMPREDDEVQNRVVAGENDDENAEEEEEEEEDKDPEEEEAAPGVQREVTMLPEDVAKTAEDGEEIRRNSNREDALVRLQSLQRGRRASAEVAALRAAKAAKEAALRQAEPEPQGEPENVHGGES